MAYVSGQPADSSKIRDFASLTRNNFVGIEDGATSFSQDFVNIKETAAPSEEITFFRLYSATDNSETALFGQTYDGSGGNSIQFSENQFMGATTQSLALQDMSFDISDAKFKLDGNFVPHAYGFVSAAGVLTAAKSKNIDSTVGLSDTSLYTITTEAIYANANAVCIVTPYGTDKTLAAVVTSITEAAGVLTIIIRIRNQDNSKNASAFQFMILGGM